MKTIVNTPSIPLCQELALAISAADLEMPFDTEKAYFQLNKPNAKFWVALGKWDFDSDIRVCPAPNVAELGILLGPSCDYLPEQRYDGGWEWTFFDLMTSQSFETEADARCNLMIFMIGSSPLEVADDWKQLKEV